MRAYQVFHRLLSDQIGATAVEYGLIAALIVIACMGALSTVGGETADLWTQVRTSVETYM